MKPVRRSIARFAWFLPGLYLLNACGGANMADSNSAAHNFSAGGSNVVQISVNPGPGDTDSQTFNIPLVTVTVCAASGSPCAQIPNVLVDSGSSGLRLMASVLSAAGLSLPATTDPDNDSNTLHECLPFADGYSWGSVSSAVVKIGGEATGSAIPVQVIDDSATPNPAAPNPANGPTCVNGTPLNSVDAFDANGVLGISTFNQDCGSGCVGANNASNGVYWSCDSGGSCTSIALALSSQVANPVASFPTDNNGVIVQLPSIPSGGAPTASGYLVFGIGTNSNNGLNGAAVLTADADGNFTTIYAGQPLSGSFIDSGSNALFFNDSTLEASTCGTSGPGAQFYCPASTVSLSATNQGINGAMNSVSFQVANLNDISVNNFAIDNAAGTAPSIANSPPYFDWGLPFFYNRTVFIAIEGMSADGFDGPYYAY